MDIRNLIQMANNIGAFFESDPDEANGVRGVADHLKKFWEPRMRREILSYVARQEGAGLKPIVLQALRTHREELGV